MNVNNYAIKMAVALRLMTRSSCLTGKRPIILQGPFAQSWTRAIFTTPAASGLKAQSAEDFWAKNKRLRRPMSPHLTIYKPQMTSLLSVTHRGTGMALAGIVYGFSLGMLVLPGSYPYYLGLISSLQFGGLIIYGAKFVLALPFAFHVCNGIRHLLWDLGYGFTLRTLYMTGYMVMGVSVVASALLAAL